MKLHWIKIILTLIVIASLENLLPEPVVGNAHSNNRLKEWNWKTDASRIAATSIDTVQVMLHCKSAISPKFCENHKTLQPAQTLTPPYTMQQHLFTCTYNQPQHAWTPTLFNLYIPNL